MDVILLFLEDVLYAFLALSVGYVFVFSLFSTFGTRRRYEMSTRKHRILVIVPSYKDDSVIMDSVNSLLDQDYDSERYDIAVVSDCMRDETNDRLSSLPIILFVINPETSSKAYALDFAINNISRDDYEIVVVMDSDNVARGNFLSEVNNAYYSGSMAIQAHRSAKNTETTMAMLDAVSEEINNSIYRKGHVNMCLSSALIGSAMAFDYKWFASNVSSLRTSGEDKELEILLLREGVFIDYLDDVYVFDYKTRREREFYNQRRRWVAAQLNSLVQGIGWLPKAIKLGRIDYIDKLVQWMMLPRILSLGIIFIFSAVWTPFDFVNSIRWWILLFLLLFSFAMAVPDRLMTPDAYKALKRLPVVFVLMFLNLFRVRGASKNFIHTRKD
jgi:cellulose synthase/poly-beta-1,6-N-acetylglucosamine synthase-like glycosyltransferase